MRNTVVFLAIMSLTAGIAGAATPDDVQFEILPAVTVVPPSPDGMVTADVTVSISTAVDGMQGWSYGVYTTFGSGFTRFGIANAVPHPDLAVANGGVNVDYDFINFYGLWAGGYIGLAQGVIVDRHAVVEIPATPEGIGSLIITVNYQGAGPGEGMLDFTDNMGEPPVEVSAVFNGFPVAPSVRDGATIVVGSQPSFIRGDFDGSGRFDIGDVAKEILYLLGRGGGPGCMDAADMNDDGKITAIDPLVGLRVALRLWPWRLPNPYPGCGADPTHDMLGCAVYTACP
jgi:hypothetical protein